MNTRNIWRACAPSEDYALDPSVPADWANVLSLTTDADIEARRVEIAYTLAHDELDQIAATPEVAFAAQNKQVRG